MIHIVDDWYVDADNYQYVCGKLKTFPNTPPKLTGCTYHGTLSGAVQRIQSERKRAKVAKGTMGLAEAVKTLSTMDKEFKQYLDTALKNQ